MEVAPYVDGGERQASRNEEMTNGCRSTGAVSPLSEAERNSYLCPSTRTDRSVLLSVNLAKSPIGQCPGKKGKMQFGHGKAH